MKEGRAIISCQARCWSVMIQETVMKRQAVIEGEGVRGMARGRAETKPRAGFKSGIQHGGEHSTEQGSNCPLM